MRKLIVVLAFLAVALWALPASAGVVLPAGDMTAHLTDASSLYYDVDNNTATPRVPADRTIPAIAPALGGENRSLFFVDGIDQTNPTPPPSTFNVFTHNAPDELTGLFYDLNLVRKTPTFDVGGTLLSVILDFEPLGRNALVADGIHNTIGSDAPAGSGGVIELYDDAPAVTFLNFAGGPGAWAEAGGVADPAANANHASGAADAYGTATDGTLWLSGVLVPNPAWGFVDGAGVAHSIVFRETITFIDAFGVTDYTGDGYGWINVFGGTQASTIGLGAYNGSGITGADVQLHVNLSLPLNTTDAPDTSGYGQKVPYSWGWQVESNDPARFSVVVPEPTIMALFGISVLGGFIRRRMR